MPRSAQPQKRAAPTSESIDEHVAKEKKTRRAYEALGSGEVLAEMEASEPKVMRALRLARAALAQRGLGRGKIRPTSVATDAHLAFLAQRRPTTLRGLREVPGFGPAVGECGDRVKHYGKELLGALADARTGRKVTTKRVLREKRNADRALIKGAKKKNEAMFEALKGARKAGMHAERTRKGGNPDYPGYVIASDVDLARVALHNDSWSAAPATIEELRTINKFGPSIGKPAERVRIAGKHIVDAINSTRVAK